MQFKIWLIALILVLFGIPALAQQDTQSTISMQDALTIAQDMYGQDYVIFEIKTEDDANDVSYWKVRLYQPTATDGSSDQYVTIYINATTGEVVNGIIHSVEATPEATPEITPEVTPEATPGHEEDHSSDSSHDDREDYRYSLTTISMDINQVLEEAQRIYPNQVIVGLKLEDDEDNLTWVVIFAEDREVE
ncbi:MAG: PepSY domain-containing protein, partial [Anaerolineae bacterium]|nr:PepSY domain-containing protein [Anaerolineae bacterium]